MNNNQNQILISMKYFKSTALQELKYVQIWIIYYRYFFKKIKLSKG
jgi:hypothetical protein